ncbi:putative G-protein coupled receptor C06G4.5 [Caenorhabditis elegans]|uniref:Probable G-protein coupled receptor C06G4.5 n=1 Tax=Caenorhabditis elegans TaxID=6239 RepID=YKR5_CAEEL|nr:putative G-protein coupled receptor C06G4.5 [Caenorhabditis elegans]P34311.3 RecName: Full=Probable G-protein coupled receptor C06G4.5 [Caenorhabditis elegans]CCD63437.1 Probable G-protein coupled receptor C06G4.5 [Caenorhabditis elegans]|eukprot:NP_498743.2 Probable G-protein coupled receptor C06G4.5 [Caenorhabditis elegans]
MSTNLVDYVDDSYLNQSMNSENGLDSVTQIMYDMKKYNIVNDVLPPPNHEDLHVVIMAVSYLLLFLLGTCGNVAVLTTIYHVIRSSRATLDNTLIYVIVLSCVDFGVCLSLPITVIDQILGFWMFGKIPCKLHAVFENFGKILSALILTAMSFDRYAGVCHPQRKRLRSRNFAITILLVLAVYAFITLCPLLWSFTAREIILYAKETAPGMLTRMKIEKCTVDIDSQMFTAFTIYQFILCYCTPLVLIAFFYTKLLSKLREHTRTFKSSQIPFLHISLYTLAVACFYFLCWTPFWMATLFAVYLENSANSSSVPPVFVYIMYFIHALPFTNSAINWILYGALNGQLQQRYRSNRSNSTKKTTTTTASTALLEKKITNLNTNSNYQVNGSMNSIATAAPTKTIGNNEVLVATSTIDDDVATDVVDVRLLSNHNPTFL